MTTNVAAQGRLVESVREYAVNGGGTMLHAREWGNADGPAILFIHGWSQTQVPAVRA